jgi:SAM-dependent methyltransferase
MSVSPPFSPSRRRTLAVIGVAAAIPRLARAQQNAGPYVPTPWSIVDEMFKLVDIRADDYVIDLGSGDGRLVIAAAERFGARGYGVDIDPELVKLANENAARAGVAGRVRFEQRDLFHTGLAEASVLTLYLLPGIVTQLVPKILAEMKPGARVISHDYPLVPWQPDRHVTFESLEKINISGTTRTVLYLYTVPARIDGEWTLELPPALGVKTGRLQFVQQPVRTTGAAVIGKRNVALEKLVVRGEDLSFVVPGLARGQPARFTGKVRGEVMEGTVALASGAAPWRGARAAAR